MAFTNDCTLIVMGGVGSKVYDFECDGMIVDMKMRVLVQHLTENELRFICKNQAIIDERGTINALVCSEQFYALAIEITAEGHMKELKNFGDMLRA